MAVADVFDPVEPRLGELEVEAVRECLRSIPDQDRPRLWELLDNMLHAAAASDLDAVDAVIARSPDGPLRRALVEILRPHLDRWRQDASADHAPTAATATARPYVRGRYRADFLPPFRGLSGTVAPVEVWSARTGLYWEKVEADAFGGVRTGKRSHEPRPLDWRHNPDVVVGCSRGFGLGRDGSLLATFDLGAHPAAQAAGAMADRGELGLSMSVRFRTRWLVYVAPDEWSPRDGVIDICVRDAASVEAVALTPAPAYPTARVTRVW